MRLRPITPADNTAAAHVIRTVMPEFGCVGEGYSINDPEVENMAGYYSVPGAAFYVLEAGAAAGAKIVGVGGYAPLAGGDGTTCELRKMYLLPEARGKGMGRLLLDTCFEGAHKDGYTRMYLETVEEMTGAAALYRKNGFVYLEAPLGATGHCSCDRYMVKNL
ncbi:MAG: GNAT family N-acetyltransferase [Bacteroidota bacterium]